MRRATGCVPSSSAHAAMYQALWSSIEGAPFRGLPHDKSTLQPAEAPRELSRRCLILQHLQRPDQRRLPDRVAVARKHPALDAAGAVAPCDPEIDEPDRLFRRSAPRSGDAGDRHRDIGGRAPPPPPPPRPRRLTALRRLRADRPPQAGGALPAIRA